MLDALNKKNNRFAWLTPLQQSSSSHGPWVLTENDTYRFLDDTTAQCRKITVDGLLSLTTCVLERPSNSTEASTEQHWQSLCGRYQVNWMHQKSCTTRLFVQNPNDYFTRVELLVDDVLLIAFQEPVWPHLQPNHHTTTNNWLIVPGECLDTLERSRVIQTDANQNLSVDDKASHSGPDLTAAA